MIDFFEITINLLNELMDTVISRVWLSQTPSYALYPILAPMFMGYPDIINYLLFLKLLLEVKDLHEFVSPSPSLTVYLHSYNHRWVY